MSEYLAFFIILILLSTTIALHYNNINLQREIATLNYSYEYLNRSYSRCVDTTREQAMEISSLTSKVDRLEREKDDLSSQVIMLNSEIERLRAEYKNSLRMEIPYKELVKFLEEDDTDEYKYIEENDYFVCVDFSDMLIKRLAEKGYFSCIVYLDFEGSENAHSIVAVRTKEYGVVYIEPQLDKIIFDLRPGDDYCRKVEQDCYSRIKHIKSCFDIPLGVKEER